MSIFHHSFYFRWEHYLRQYALHKKSLKMEKSMLQDAQLKEKIQHFQDNGVSWHDVRLFDYFILFCLFSRLIYFINSVYLFAVSIFDKSCDSSVWKSPTVDVHVHFRIFCWEKQSKGNFRNEPRQFANSHWSIVTIFGARHNYR